MRALGFAGLVGDTMPAPGAGRGGRGTIAPPPTPKGPFTPAQMQQAIAAILRITPNDISIKATTTELMGFVGRGEGLMAYATVLLQHAANR